MTAVTVPTSSALTEKRRPLLGLLVSQFLGAFNDNAWKIIVFTLATRAFIPGTALFATASQYQATLGLLLFLIPMLIFSIPAGVLADRHSKRSVIISMKALELVLMGAAIFSLWLAPSEIVLPYTVLGLMGLQSALFGPAKYGILPELLPKERLSHGNGLLEMLTMLAIIGGTGLGPVFLAADSRGTLPSMTWTAPLWLFMLSAVGFAAALKVPHVAPAQTVKHGMFSSIHRARKAINGDTVLFLAIVGSAFYWFTLSLLGQNILVYSKALVNNLQQGELLQGIPPAAYGVGIGIGAFFSGKLSGNRIEYGLIPLGAIGFAITALMLGFLQPAMTGTVIILILMGIASGTVIVPLHAIVQWRAPKDRRGGIIAFGNILDVTGMILGSLLAAGMARAGLGLEQTMIVSAFTVVLATMWCVRLLPDALIRLVFILLTITFYRIRVLGEENIPKKGPALLASNHMSIIDALFVMTTVDRPIHFMVKEEFYNKWWVRPIASIMGAIPLSTSGGTQEVLKGLKTASEKLEKGHLVCIFPEGQISLTGMMLPFKRGIEVMMKGRSCPIIPIHLDLVWGSLFTAKGAKFFTKIPHHLPYPLTVSFGKALPADTPVPTIRESIQELGCEAWSIRQEHSDLVHKSFIKLVRWKPWKTAIADANLGKLTRLKTLVGAIAVARCLRKKLGDQQTIGLLLPPCVPAVLANLAGALSCRTVVNLNFTAGIMGMESAVEQAEIQTILTSRTFLEKAKVPFPKDITPLYFEDFRKEISSRDKLVAALIALFAPFRAVEKYCGSKKSLKPEDPLSIIFTSGSTGNPKGAILSHYNISSNVEGVSQVIPPLSKQDKLLGALPLFHSFGYMQMWLALNHDYELILHPSPLDAPMVGQLVNDHQISIMLTTPTFLKLYLQKIPPEQFGSLHCVLTGAEKLPKKIEEAFENRFGIRPIEGYGATECSPVISACVPGIRMAGVCQTGSVRGTVGRPLPGVRVKVVHHETNEPLPPGESGLLLVKGPNVMQGYLHREDLTAKVIQDGWYVTGDIGSVDEEGFIRLTDRLSRFSKIGGEMVPHGTIEEALHQAINVTDQIFAVTAIPDHSKGERIAVIHTYDEDKLPELLRKLKAQGFPNLFIPRLNHFIKVDALPALGTGKLNLSAIKTTALLHLS